MSTAPKILAFAGSARRDSFNKRLIAIAAHGARVAGAEVTLIDLRDYPMPLFNQDDESTMGQPEHALRLRALMAEHQGLLIASPEYNSSISPLLKNTIDWVSRPNEDETALVHFVGRTAGLVSASPGGLGGLRGLVHLRAILGNIGVLVLPEQVAIPAAHTAFDDKGNLIDPTQLANVEKVGARLAEIVAKLYS